MITDKEIESAVYARFSGSDVQNSACRGAWRYGANWAIDRMKLELVSSEAFRQAADKVMLETINENAKLKALLDSIISTSDEEKAMRKECRNYEDEVYAAIEAAKKDLK